MADLELDEDRISAYAGTQGLEGLVREGRVLAALDNLTVGVQYPLDAVSQIFEANVFYEFGSSIQAAESRSLNFRELLRDNVQDFYFKMPILERFAKLSYDSATECFTYSVIHASQDSLEVGEQYNDEQVYLLIMGMQVFLSSDEGLQCGSPDGPGLAYLSVNHPVDSILPFHGFNGKVYVMFGKKWHLFESKKVFQEDTRNIFTYEGVLKLEKGKTYSISEVTALVHGTPVKRLGQDTNQEANRHASLDLLKLEKLVAATNTALLFKPEGSFNYHKFDKISAWSRRSSDEFLYQEESLHT